MSGYRDIGDADPFAPGRELGNTLNALFAAHDNGDYYLAHGGIGRASRRRSAPGSTSRVGRAGGAADQRRAGGRRRRSTTSSAGPASFRPTRRSTRAPSAAGRCGCASLGGTRWWVTADLLGGRRSTHAAGSSARCGTTLGGARGAHAAGEGRARHPPDAPAIALPARRDQHRARLRLRRACGARRSGRPSSTSRRSADGSGRWRSSTSGQAGRPGDLFSSRALVGGGVGLSLFGGLVRFDLSHPISPDTAGRCGSTSCCRRRDEDAVLVRVLARSLLRRRLRRGSPQRRRGRPGRLASRVDRCRYRAHGGAGRGPSGATACGCSRSGPCRATAASRWRSIPREHRPAGQLSGRAA